ncbi:angiotensin-converting enzyme [Anabrus simplex]|uniref:angiotensin-converting enzyme n=1 Tax=Anabrus simplex TaxID=316456 RepID=UPI0035A38FA1
MRSLTGAMLLLTLQVVTNSALSGQEGHEEVTQLLRVLDSQLRVVNSVTADITWRITTRRGPDVHLDTLATKLGEARSNWLNKWCSRVPRFLGDHVTNLDPLQARQFYLLCRGPHFTKWQARAMEKVWNRLQGHYMTARVCRRHNDTCLPGEPDLERLMRTSRDPAELLWAWEGWRSAVGPPSKDLYTAFVNLQNQGARNNGYSDIGQCWREELETPNLESVADKLYQQVEPLYKMLHAVVRHRLRQYYGDSLVSATGPIPAHLMGNMWAQDWSALLDLMTPPVTLNLTAALLDSNYTVWGMVKRAEDLYTSLGLEPMTRTFWERSQVERQSNAATCHGTAANLYRDGDYRMLLCAQVNEEDFYVIHHEMGHIVYYMAYRDQPVIFQDGANSAFQEAVGDTIMHAVMTPQHLQRLGLVNDTVPIQDLGFTLLLHQALSKIPQLAFGLVVDKWRWRAFDGRISPADYNKVWWDLKLKYQGVEPPVARKDDDFDPAAKYHIPDHTPYIRYFLSGILQVQMFKALCELAVLGAVGRGELPMSLHHCDLYGSKDAGKRLRAMMSLGSSRPWQEALLVLTGSSDYSTHPLLQYYAPVAEWLHMEIEQHNIPVGW